MLNRSNERVQAILRDLEGARKYVIDGQHEHPNRRDAVITPANDFPRNSVSNTPAANPQSGGFGALSSAAHNNGSAFGKPSGLGATNSAFGAPSQLGAATSGFGRSSSVGGGASSAFGQPSTLGGGGASGFSQPSTLGQTATFGQPSQPNAFGAPSALGSQKSAFGQPSQPSPFAAAQQQTQGNSNTSFGQPLQSSPFGGAQPPAASPFAQPPAASSGGGFSQPSTLGSNLNKPSPFAPANNQQGSSAFGAPSGLGLGGQTSNSVSPFAQAQPPSQQNASPFGQQQPQQARTASPFAGGFQNAGAGLQLNKQVRRADDGTSFYLKPHPTEPHKQVKVKVWMPNGPPTAAHLDAEGPAEAYSDGSAVEEIKKTYATAMQRGTFEGSAMPELPPKREWLEWDV
jgi:nucleoporin NUP42